MFLISHPDSTPITSSPAPTRPPPMPKSNLTNLGSIPLIIYSSYTLLNMVVRYYYSNLAGANKLTYVSVVLTYNYSYVITLTLTLR